MEKRIFYLGLGLITAIALVFFLFNSQTGLFLLEKNTEDFSDNDFGETNFLLEQRASYNLSPAIFSDLPEPPKDFSKIVSLYHNREFRDDMFFSEKYFLQPEFYPGFSKNGLNYWLNPPTTHYGAYGYGSFPNQKTIFLKTGERTKARFFFHSGYGVRTYQGIKLEPIFYNAENMDFFDVYIKEPVFLLGPNFPKFEKNWAKDVSLEVFVKSGAPKGTYNFRIIIGIPPGEFRDKWVQEISGKYFDAGFVSIDKPVFELIIIVE